MEPIRVAIVGCCGRMGKMLVRMASADAAFRLVAAVTTADDPLIGKDAGAVAGVDELGVAVSQRCEAACDVAIEFTLPAGCHAWAEWCGTQGIPLVSGTTGLSEEDWRVVRAAAQRVPVVWVPNMSIGVNLLLRVVGDVARQLGPGWDVEICETHHADKIDAPSGTARALLEQVCEARGWDPQRVAVHGRQGQCGPRRAGEIGVHSLRLGNNIGEHEVHFAAPGETLTLRHRAHARDIFAAGALRAARWIVGREPGLYSMGDVLAG